MNKKEYRKLNVKKKELAILELASVVTKRQRCPYTFIELEITAEDRLYTGWGISKVSFPDKWDASSGEWVATQRAVRDIRKQLEQDEI